MASKQNHIGRIEDIFRQLMVFAARWVKRVWQHRNKEIEGFTSQYAVFNLVYFEQFGDIYEMARRERRIKEWKRAWKIRVIEQQNPVWADLFDTIC